MNVRMTHISLLLWLNQIIFDTRTVLKYARAARPSQALYTQLACPNQGMLVYPAGLSH